ncbi:hypothetical protein [Chryseobacterium indoltheticum]
MRLTGAADVLESVDQTLPGSYASKITSKQQTDIIIITAKWFGDCNGF